MKSIISSYPNYATDLSPRLILGLWHPVFLDAALQHVPSMRRIHIGGSPWLARTYFWKHCDGFSMWFPSLVGTDGQALMDQARKDEKDIFVWTVNRKDEMVEATRWGVKAILTDKTDLLKTLKVDMTGDYASTRSNEVGVFFRWASWKYWTPFQWIIQSHWLSSLEKRAGISFKEAWKTAEHIPIPSIRSEDAVVAAIVGGNTERSDGSVELAYEEQGSSSSGSSTAGSPGLRAVDEKNAGLEAVEPAVPVFIPTVGAAA